MWIRSLEENLLENRQIEALDHVPLHLFVDNASGGSLFAKKKTRPKWCTLPETNIAPENGWLEYYFPIGKAYFQGLC